MTKNLTYSTFALASVIVVGVFLSVKTFTHLTLAVLLYSILIFLAFNIFPRTTWKIPKIVTQIPPKLKKEIAEQAEPTPVSTYIANIDKRDFIKLIGATGISFFLFSLLGRRVEPLLFGQSGQSANNTLPTGNNNQSEQSSITAGYKISEVDEGIVSYYGFTNKDGAWQIMKENIDDGSYRYAKGNSDFKTNWSKRTSLNFEYF